MNTQFKSRQHDQEIVQRLWTNEIEAVKEQPWLAALLLARREQFFARWTHIYHQLAALPRNARRRLRKQAATSLLGVALLISLGKIPTLQAANITVTPGAAAFFGGDGCSLAEAIVNANNDAAIYAECPAGSGADTITLAGNTYSYTNALSADGETALPEILSDMTIEGGGATIERVADTFDFRILKVGGVYSNLTLNNITIRGGYSSPNDGGGIFVDTHNRVTITNSTISDNHSDDGGGVFGAIGSAVTIADSTISGNTAYRGGGVFSVQDSTVTITNTSVMGNSAFARGGGIYGYTGSAITLTDSTLNSNTATNNTIDVDAMGGAVYMHAGSNFSLTDSVVGRNSADFFGGGLSIRGTATISGSTIRDNVAERVSGGGLFTFSSSNVNINHSTFDNNTARFGGAIMNNGEMTIANSTIQNNTANRGGGINASGSSTTLVNSTISNNTAGNNLGTAGGGIDIGGDSAVFTIDNSTISGNAASVGGGIGVNLPAVRRTDVATENSVATLVNITRSIISGNTASFGAEIAAYNTPITSDTNLLGNAALDGAAAFEGFPPAVSDLTATSDGTTPTALSDILETTLADNGGPTFTHALVADSPAIDVVAAARIPAATCTAGELDQRGEARANGPNQGGTACDLGAYEYITHPTAIAMQTSEAERATPWLLAALGSLLAPLTTWIIRRKQP